MPLNKTHLPASVVAALILACLSGGWMPHVLAQAPRLTPVGLSKPAPADPAAAPSATDKNNKKKGGTTITADQDATFDNEAHKATFSGNVKVKDPEFDLSCDHLTVFLNSNDKPAAEGEKSQSALREAIAEGNVNLLQRRVSADGTEKVYRGKGQHGTYNAGTGEFRLTGWPEVQQGINSHIATEENTVMTIFREGKMNTKGGNRTVIQESPDEQ